MPRDAAKPHPPSTRSAPPARSSTAARPTAQAPQPEASPTLQPPQPAHAVPTSPRSPPPHARIRHRRLPRRNRAPVHRWPHERRRHQQHPLPSQLPYAVKPPVLDPQSPLLPPHRAVEILKQPSRPTLRQPPRPIQQIPFQQSPNPPPVRRDRHLPVRRQLLDQHLDPGARLVVQRRHSLRRQLIGSSLPQPPRQSSLGQRPHRMLSRLREHIEIRPNLLTRHPRQSSEISRQIRHRSRRRRCEEVRRVPTPRVDQAEEQPQLEPFLRDPPSGLFRPAPMEMLRPRILQQPHARNDLPQRRTASRVRARSSTVNVIVSMRSPRFSCS
jgi:hypothetical protein